MKNNKGFSLVELIVVIAIMAILAAVAVVGFSVYIPKAQQAGDRQTINDVIDAFELYYYSNPEDVTAGYVVLGSDGAVKYDDFGDKAMTAAFGANWKTEVKLQYEDWQGVSSTLSYGNSSYFGHESELIGTVDKLTTALGDVVMKDESFANTLIGDEFDKFLTTNSVNKEDGKAIGNAAVLYVAQNTQGAENQAKIKEAFEKGLSATANSPSDVVNNLYAELSKTDIGDAAAMAAIYAYAEGYAQETNQADAFHSNTDFSQVTNAPTALEAIGASFDKLDPTKFSEYKDNQGNKDLQGYLDMMGTVHENANIVSGNLNSADCFTDGTVENLLTGHAAMGNLQITTENGQVAIVLTVDEDGNFKTHVAPLNWDK